MPSKVVWIAFLLTMVYWLGNAFGCATSGGDSGTQNQNYEELDGERERDMFNPRADPTKPGAMIVNPDSAYRYAQADTADEMKIAVSETSPSGPSLTGIDRSHWGKQVITPASGRAHHTPVLFHDWEIRHGFKKLRDSDPLDQQIEAAYDGAEARTYSAPNVAGVILQPLAFVGDLVIAPLRMVGVVEDEPLVKSDKR